MIFPRNYSPIDFVLLGFIKKLFQVGVRGKNCVVIGVEKKSIPTLQDDRTIRKIHSIDEHVMLAFAGCQFFHIIYYR